LPTYQEWMARQQESHVEAQRQAALVGPRPPQPSPTASWTPGHAARPVHSPALLYEYNSAVPGYLTVPEERAEGEGLAAVFFRELMRALLKAAGQALASFFDSRRLK
jgi:hypothetical protein